jgi:zinc transporter 1
MPDAPTADNVTPQNTSDSNQKRGSRAATDITMVAHHTKEDQLSAMHRAKIQNYGSTPSRSVEDEVAILPAHARVNVAQLAAQARARQNVLSKHDDSEVGSSRASLSTPLEDSEDADVTPYPESHITGTEHYHGHDQNRNTESGSVPKKARGALNMHGVFLHVLGDALGSVAVIISALVIWLTEWEYRYYVDPVISILITTMIVSFSVPLVRSASFILLQGVPHSVPIEEVHASILELEGVASVHELHIWQLSDTKLIASVHVLVDGGHDYMRVTRRIKRLLHTYGIHSTTVQPEQLPIRDETMVPNESVST